MRARRAFLLLSSLFLTLILVLLSLAFLESQALRYRGSTEGIARAQARALATAGIEDARAKLSRDLRFPPTFSLESQPVFSYSEDVLDLDGEPVGSYEVLVDHTCARPPVEIVLLRSVGAVGPRARPSAQHVVTVELDINRSRSPILHVLRWAESDVP